MPFHAGRLGEKRNVHNRWHRRHALRPRAGDTKARTASIISAHRLRGAARSGRGCVRRPAFRRGTRVCRTAGCRAGRPTYARMRSEEHTSELQSLMRTSYAVFCLKKKKITDEKLDEKG